MAWISNLGLKRKHFNRSFDKPGKSDLERPEEVQDKQEVHGFYFHIKEEQRTPLEALLLTEDNMLLLYCWLALARVQSTVVQNCGWPRSGDVKLLNPSVGGQTPPSPRNAHVVIFRPLPVSWRAWKKKTKQGCHNKTPLKAGSRGPLVSSTTVTAGRQTDNAVVKSTRHEYVVKSTKSVAGQVKRDEPQFGVSWETSERCSSSAVLSLERVLQKLLSDFWDVHKQNAQAAVDGDGSWIVVRTLLWSIHQTDPSVLRVKRAHTFFFLFFFGEMKTIFPFGQVYYHPHDSHVISFQYKPS